MPAASVRPRLFHDSRPPRRPLKSRTSRPARCRGECVAHPRAACGPRAARASSRQCREFEKRGGGCRELPNAEVESMELGSVWNSQLGSSLQKRPWFLGLCLGLGVSASRHREVAKGETSRLWRWISWAAAGPRGSGGADAGASAPCRGLSSLGLHAAPPGEEN